VTSNIWSHSGLQGGGGGGSVGDLGTGVTNVIRFNRANGQTIDQNNAVSTMTSETVGATLKAHADLTPAYSSHSSEVKSWKRDIEFQGNKLHVHDSCQVAAGITPTFQINVPVKPVNKGGGTIVAGALQVNTSPGSSVKFVDMTGFTAVGDEGETLTEFEKGWRIDIGSAGGCEFDVDLTALAAPAS
jgi:hypothetical protein